MNKINLLKKKKKKHSIDQSISAHRQKIKDDPLRSGQNFPLAKGLDRGWLEWGLSQTGLVSGPVFPARPQGCPLAGRRPAEEWPGYPLVLLLSTRHLIPGHFTSSRRALGVPPCIAVGETSTRILKPKLFISHWIWPHITRRTALPWYKGQLQLWP